jgi:hypothetical protein
MRKTVDIKSMPLHKVQDIIYSTYRLLENALTLAEILNPVYIKEDSFDSEKFRGSFLYDYERNAVLVRILEGNLRDAVYLLDGRHED